MYKDWCTSSLSSQKHFDTERTLEGCSHDRFNGAPEELVSFGNETICDGGVMFVALTVVRIREPNRSLDVVDYSRLRREAREASTLRKRPSCQ